MKHSLLGSNGTVLGRLKTEIENSPRQKIKSQIRRCCQSECHRKRDDILIMTSYHVILTWQIWIGKYSNVSVPLGHSSFPRDYPGLKMSLSGATIHTQQVHSVFWFVLSRGAGFLPHSFIFVSLVAWHSFPPSLSLFSPCVVGWVWASSNQYIYIYTYRDHEP